MQNRLFKFTGVSAFFFLSVFQQVRAWEEISLDGTWWLKYTTINAGEKANWHKLTFRPTDALPARVPGIVQSALVENGKEAHPYWAKDNERMRWVEDREWWYFRSFDVPEAQRGKALYLAFEGISYSFKIWLNGKQIGGTTGMFRRTYIKVSHLLKYGGENFLIVKAVPPPKNRMESVSCQMSFGWDFAPRLQAVGIWSNVRLEARGGVVSFFDPYILTRELRTDGSALLNVSTTVQSHHNRHFNLNLRGRIWPKGDPDAAVEFIKRVALLAPGKSRHVDLNVLVPQAKLWWPWFMSDLGKPQLYEAHLETVLDDGSVDDETKFKFGIRTVSLKHNTDSTYWDYPWTFVVNGKQFYCTGSNWVPLDSLFNFDRKWYRRLLKMAIGQNIKMLRIWGGGISETHDFFELCDEMGILNWQEFWLSWGHYPKLDRDIFITSAKEQIRRLRNHPSIFLWCGGNEIDPDNWEHADLIGRLQIASTETDPARPFMKASPHRGDEHNWKVWHQNRTYLEYHHFTKFRSEAGLQAPPHVESLIKFIPKDQLWPPGESWGKGGHTYAHNGDIPKISRYAREYGKLGNLEDFVRKAQFSQAMTYQYNVEHSRWQMYRNSGVLVWQFNEPWPSICWSMVDYFGVPKPVYYYFKRASEPVALVADYLKYHFKAGQGFDVWLKIINENRRPLKGLKLHAQLRNGDGKIFAKWEKTANIGPDTVINNIITCHWNIPRNHPDNILYLNCSVTDSDGRDIHRNIYPFGVSVIQPPSKPVRTLFLTQYHYETDPVLARLSSYGITVTRTLPVDGVIKLPSRDPGKLVKDFDVIFIHAGPDMAKLLGYRQMQSLVGAVKRGCGIVLDGGPKSYIGSGFNDTPIEEVMPVEMKPKHGVAYHKGTWVLDTLDLTHPLLKGLDWKALGAISDYSLLRPKKDAKVLATVQSGSPLLTVGTFGKGRAIAFAASLRSGPVVSWSEHEAFFSRLISYAAGQPDDEVASIDAILRAYEGLNDLKTVSLDFKVPEKVVLNANGKTIMPIEIANSDTSLAFFVGVKMNWVPKDIYASLNDNYIWLWPGETRRLELKFDPEAPLTGEHLIHVGLEGWNVKKKDRSLRLVME